MSTEDGPGIRTTVFFKQCPLRCKWCHNPESILKKKQLEWFEHKCIGCNTCIEICDIKALHFADDGLNINRELCTSCGKCSDECPSTALHMFGEYWTLDDLYYEIHKDKVYYDQSKGGITVSGGEPTIQSDFIIAFLKKCKDNGISTALDTCGYASKAIYEKILPHVDLVLLDIKEINPKKHEEFTGVSNKLILENAIWMSEYIKENNKKIWIRTPLIPKFTANKQNIEGIGRFIVEKLNNNPERWDLLAFNNLCISKYDRLDLDWVLKDSPLMTKQEVENLYDVALKTGVSQVKWSGLTKKED